MLVMSRKVGEWIDVGTDIKIVISQIRGDKVRIGIDAPKDVAIHRREIAELIARKRDQEYMGE